LLANQLNIPWYVFADGEPQALGELNSALNRLCARSVSDCSNIVVIPNGRNFEQELIATGYLPEIEIALNEVHGVETFLDKYIADNDGLPRAKNKGVRNYSVAGGRETAALDALKGLKTRMAKPIATTISSLTDRTRRFPTTIENLLIAISSEHDLTKAEENL
jgi:putative ATP-dependent endonuclease of the OLD family